MKCCVRSVALCGYDTLTLLEVRRKYLGRFWNVLDWSCDKRRSITYTQREKEYPAYSKNKANFIGHVLCTKCLLKYVMEGNKKGRIEVAGKQRRRGKQLLDDLTEWTE